MSDPQAFMPSTETLFERIGDNTMIVNMGPQHPSTHGVLRIILELEGEVIVNLECVIGYLHTGMEKEAEYQQYLKCVTMTDRMDYLAANSNNLAHALSIEQLLDLEVPARGQALRVLLTELSRIASHCVWLGTHALDLGAMTPFFWIFREREKILDMFEMISGDLCMNLGLSGPIIRASGVPWDLRKSNPYSGYEKYDFAIPVGHHGDVYDRFLVRLAEMRESLKIIEQVIDGLPEGPWNSDDRKVVPPPREELDNSMESLIHHFKLWTEGYHPPVGESYVGIEGPKGEIGWHIVSDGSNRPYRWHVRPPSLVNLQALKHMCMGRMIADVVAIIGSIDIVLGEIDR